LFCSFAFPKGRARVRLFSFFQKVGFLKKVLTSKRVGPAESEVHLNLNICKPEVEYIKGSNIQMNPSFEAKTSLIQFCSLGKDSQRNKATLGLLMTKIVFF